MQQAAHPLQIEGGQMTILRIKHSKNFTCIDNQAVRDPRLSFKARGLHHLLLSYPNDWRVSRDQLTTQSDKDGREAIGSALKELMTLGYIERRKGKDGSGRFVYESIVHELPSGGFSGSGDKAQKTDTEGDVGENSSDGFSDSGKGLFDENQSVLSSDGFSSGGDRVPLISNVRQSTDQQNTNTKERVLENFDLKEPDPEPTEANWQRSWIRCPIEKQSPDQASNGSAQVTSSAAAPLAVENQKHPTAKTDDYYKTAGATKNKPELPADLEHIWVGLGRLDYLPALVDTCTRYLKSLEKPCSNSNAITYIANRIRDREWTAIELRLQEMAEYAQKRQNSESRVNHPQRPPDGFEGSSGAYRHHSDDNAPKAFVDMNPQEQAEYKAAIAAMRSKTAGLEFSSIGEAIAQAAELGVAS